ncbi:hypothetical protein [Streptomyces sp. STCH 565 A]|uniref:hypothetical protein n=1 Tax=Streptomyces sp. STCH 565 A TaxID=2950532 RepID=UPI002074B378|nr:hypothetical protein [Streptomyces sp. STCH 565 A]MCM8548962.1 hypothetical protein [Streptomyces sp. STCH 565 A]
MATAIVYDREPGAIADVLEINGETVCVINAAALAEHDGQQLVRDFLRSLGVDCTVCRGCPVGTAGQAGID